MRINKSTRLPGLPENSNKIFTIDEKREETEENDMNGLSNLHDINPSNEINENEKSSSRIHAFLRRKLSKTALKPISTQRETREAKVAKEAKEAKEIKLAKDKETMKGFKLRFYIERQNGFHGLFRTIVKLNSAEWCENHENDPIFCN
eukprot:CAMPEP_0116891474 /NCGR_PEP_ID=MMETSP0467-20121206/1883_1 /TAXON_ID=283647 /ORGANISM="Mesodinium pulex, Strain SPMC105" /LENGTH=147 /DNA_ID=CAMNT_0004560011 /DNA_START=456 /DNA_END=899 /DNA_ORIENTATION=+